MTRDRAYHKRQQQAKRQRLRKAREHLLRGQARAHRHLCALEQALIALGLPETPAAEVQWRLKAGGKLLGKLFGVMFPVALGCRTAYELSRVGGWDKKPAREALECPANKP